MAKVSSRDVNFDGSIYRRVVTVNTDGEFARLNTIREDIDLPQEPAIDPIGS